MSAGQLFAFKLRYCGKLAAWLSRLVLGAAIEPGSEKHERGVESCPVLRL